MTDQELRGLVRDAVARHMGRGTATALEPPPAARPAAAGARFAEPSHAIYLTVVNTTDACVIEPAVACNHCNYCRSHGY